jgi:hypothetical protein
MLTRGDCSETGKSGVKLGKEKKGGKPCVYNYSCPK